MLAVGSQSTITGATVAAATGDTISIGAGTYTEHPSDAGKTLTIGGAGPTQTLVQPPAANSTTTFTLTGATSSISGLGLVLATGNTNTGLQLGASGESASNLAVSAPAGDTGTGDVRETEAITRCRAYDLRAWARSSPRHQDVRDCSGSEALLLDDVELQVLIEIGEWAAAGTDRNRDRR